MVLNCCIAFFLKSRTMNTYCQQYHKQITCRMIINYGYFLHLMWGRVWSDQYENPLEFDQDFEDGEYNSTTPFHGDNGGFPSLAWTLIRITRPICSTGYRARNSAVGDMLCGMRRDSSKSARRS